MAKRRRTTITTTKVAVLCAAVTTLLALAASGLVFVTGGQRYAENIHWLAMFIMLIAYVFLIATLKAARKHQLFSLNVVETDDSFVISPCGVQDCFVLDQRTIDGRLLESRTRKRSHSIRVLIARELTVSDSFLDDLMHFPNLTLLDLQNSTVPQAFWSRLEELPSLTNVIATNAISDELLRTISLSLPEVKFWTGKYRNLVVASTASLKATIVPK